MTCLNIRTRVAAVAIALALVPAFAYAEGDTPAKKEIAGGRQRLNPRPAEEPSQLSGVPTDTTLAPAPSMHGFGPLSGNPLLGGFVPLKAGN
jgi:hypothetical protein